MFFGFSRAVGDVGMRAIIVTDPEFKFRLFQRTKNFISCGSSEAHALFANGIELTLSLLVDVEMFKESVVLCYMESLTFPRLLTDPL
jgi:hypothetical protein